MKRVVVPCMLVVWAAFATSARAQEPAADARLLEQANRILAESPLIDGHNDLPWAFRENVGTRLEAIDLAADTKQGEHPLQTDLPRLRRGRVGAQFWSVYVPSGTIGAEAVVTVLEQIDFVHRMTTKHSDTLEMAYAADDVERIVRSGRIASMIGMEGGHSIGDSLAVLRQAYRAGARYMTLTHSDHNNWADSATGPPRHGGLTPFGREVVREMNRLGMLVDLSHVSPKTMHDALDTTEAPVIFSHSSARAIASHPRNVPDDVLARIPENGGVVMVTFVPPFISEATWEWSSRRRGKRQELEAMHPADPEAARRKLDEWVSANPAPPTSTRDVADHIDHVRKVAGIEHIGIGSDFDGIGSTPVDLTGVEDFPALFAELLRRGYSADELRKIASANVLRVMREAERTAVRLQRERPPSDARITDASD